MKSYAKEINSTVRYIKYHFQVDGWPLSYILNKPNIAIGLDVEDQINIEIEFIGKLLDNGFNVIHAIDGIKIVKLKDEYYV